MTSTYLLIVPPLAAVVGAIVSFLSKRRIWIRVRTSGKLTGKDRQQLFIQSIVPSILYGAACAFFWVMVSVTSPVPNSLWRHILSSLPCFSIGFIGGFVAAVRQIDKLRIWLRRNHPYGSL